MSSKPESNENCAQTFVGARSRGAGLSVAGILKVKGHVDSPANHPLKDGLMRLAAGGALLSLPFMTAAMQGSINGGILTGPAIGSLTTFNFE